MQLPASPFAAPQMQQAEPRVIARAIQRPPPQWPPPRPTEFSCRLSRPTSCRIPTTATSATRRSDPSPMLANTYRKRLSPHVQRRQRSEIHADVVVGHRSSLARAPDASVCRRSDRPSPACPTASPAIRRSVAAGAPSDLRIVRRGERPVLHVASDGIVQVADESRVIGEPDGGCDVAFRRAEGPVDAVRVAPLEDDVAVAQHQPAVRPRDIVGPTISLYGSPASIFASSAPSLCVFASFSTANLTTSWRRAELMPTSSGFRLSHDHRSG